MKLSPKQTNELLKSIGDAKPDSLGCDGCAALMDQYAQHELDGTDSNELLESVKRHLAQCVCCRYEYGLLIQALKAIDEPNG